MEAASFNGRPVAGSGVRFCAAAATVVVLIVVVEE